MFQQSGTNSVEVFRAEMQNMQALIALKGRIQVKGAPLFRRDGSPSPRVHHPQYLQIVVAKNRTAVSRPDWLRVCARLQRNHRQCERCKEEAQPLILVNGGLQIAADDPEMVKYMDVVVHWIGLNLSLVAEGVVSLELGVAHTIGLHFDRPFGVDERRGRWANAPTGHSHAGHATEAPRFANVGNLIAGDSDIHDLFLPLPILTNQELIL